MKTGILHGAGDRAGEEGHGPYGMVTGRDGVGKLLRGLLQGIK